MTAIVTRIKPNLYKDSVALMRIAEKLLTDPAITRATLVMATAANKDILQEAGLLTTEADGAAPSDLIVVIEGGDSAAISAAFALVDVSLLGGSQAGGGAVQEVTPKTLGMALTGRAAAGNADPTVAANLMQISVPGAYAGAEALKAVKAGLNVFLFSDNVPLEQERTIKQLAQARGLLVMGPDCGTAIIGGVPLGFANVVRRGSIGLIGASGTGLQEISSQIHLMGAGVSHAIGTGGRDVKAEIGGITMLMALDLLAADADTKVIGIVSKPPAPEVMARVIERAGQAGKPVVVVFLGGAAISMPDNVQQTGTLYECAAACVAAAHADQPGSGPVPSAAIAPRMAPGAALGPLPGQCAAQRRDPARRWLRGLFSGGTFCTEAQAALRTRGLPCWSNVPLDQAWMLADLQRSREHTMLDLGDDDFTVGKPHPMIDPSTRIARIAQEAADPETAVLLLDIVLGYGGHLDPAGALGAAIMQARAGRELAVVAFVCGTEQDPQVRSQQEAKLKAAGCLVAASSTQAVQWAAALLHPAMSQPRSAITDEPPAMRNQRIVVALGGNAAYPPTIKGTAEEQLDLMAQLCEHFVRMIEAGYKLVLTHGNGPVVGNILYRMAKTARELPPMPMDVCVAHSQGGMGYMFEQSFTNVLRRHHCHAVVAAVLTEVEVDPHDPAFTHPTKPVGKFFTQEEAAQMAQETGWIMREDAGRGYRRVVPSPQPLAILDLPAIEALIAAGIIPIAAGGGGIPVVRDANGDYKGVPAVIDKDLTSAMLAAQLHADTLVMITGVEQVMLDFGKPSQRGVARMTVSEARQHLADGQFPAGSMGPKIDAAVRYLEQFDGAVVITSLERTFDAVEGRAGTRIVRDA